MNDSQAALSPAQVSAAGLDNWLHFHEALLASFRTGDFATGLEFVSRLGAAAERANHHPVVTLSYPEVNVTLTSHDVAGITNRDLDLARQISAIAADMGVDLA